MSEATIRRRATRAGLLLRKSRRRNPADECHGLYVLVEDRAGNRARRAQAPISAFAAGEGKTLEGVDAELTVLGH